jgi:hypothetical protein
MLSGLAHLAGFPRAPRERQAPPVRSDRDRERTRTLAGLGVTLLLALPGLGCTSSTTETADGGPDGGPAAALCLPLDAGLPVATRWLGVDAGPSGEPLDTFLDDYYAAFCDAMSRCFPFESYLIPNCLEQLHSFGIYSSPTNCSPTPVGLGCLTQSFDVTNLQAFVAAVDAGLSYDAHMAAACLAAPWTACPDIETNVSLPTPCDSIFGGLVPDGGACQFDLECTLGACLRPGTSCDGTCMPSSALPPAIRPGSDCTYTGACGDTGLTCDGEFCRGGAGPGASCEASSFFAFYDCAAGLYCEPASGKCQPQIAEGGSCLTGFLVQADPLAHCARGLSCIGEAILVDGGTRPGTCEPPSRMGGPCVGIRSDEAQQRSGCVVGGVCSCGVCVPPPTSGACADGWTPCLPDVSACDYADTLTCRPLSNFENCSNGQQCTNGYCDTSTGICSDAPLLDSCPG